jgi:hypothetical protein
VVQALGVVLWILSGQAGGPPRLRVVESELRLVLGSDGATVLLPVDNPGPPGAGRLRVQSLGPDDAVRAAVEQSVELSVGRSVIALRLPVREGEPHDVAPPDWFLGRLRYDLTASGGESVTGLRAVSAAATGLVHLRVVGNRFPRHGDAALLRIRAVDARSGAPLPGAEVEARVSPDPEAPVIRGTTGGDGEVELSVPLPAVRLHGPLAVEITGRRAGVATTVRTELFLGASIHALVTTDKPLYQPGQTLRARVLVLEPHQRVIAGVRLRVGLLDPEGTLAHRADLATSRHGIASFEWPIPERAALGRYVLTVELHGDESGSAPLASVDVRVGRYELPLFRLEAATERPFHLPSERARAVVRVESLTGEPLRGARVRVRREDGDQEVSSSTDGRGVASVDLDLADHHRQIDDDDDPPFGDVGFEAHVTDPVSGRSESRRFDVRVTREPIHVYWRSRNFRDWEGRPLDGYVSTSTADGHPVSCDVRLSGPDTLSVRTDRSGLARVRGKNPIEAGREGNLRLRIEARDAGGRRGSAQPRLYPSDGDSVTLDPEHVLLRAGESVRARVQARPPTTVLVQLWSGSRRLAGRRIDAGEQGALIEFPYRDHFSGLLSLTAERLGEALDDRTFHSVGLLYPTGRRVASRITVQPERARPGSEVEARVRLADGGGRPIAGVVGLAGVDLALLERAADETGGGSAFEPALPWGGERPGGWGFEDLDALDPSGPFTAEQHLAAEILLGWGQVWLESQESERPDVQAAYRPAVVQRLEPLRRALAETSWGAVVPSDVGEIERAAAAHRIDLHGIEDPWGNRCRIRLTPSQERRLLQLSSDGPDEVPDTRDDLDVEVASWLWYAREGRALRRALARHVARTARMPRTLAALDAELREAGLHLATQKDPWGRPLQFSLEHAGTTARIRVESPGSGARGDRFEVWRAEAEVPVRTAVDWGRSLRRWADAHGRLPRDARELRTAGLSPRRLRDPWDGGCRVVFQRVARYLDRLTAGRRDAAGAPAREVVTPVTEELDVVTLLGDGPDGEPETEDDVVLATFARAPGPGQALATTGALATSLPGVVSADRGGVAGFVIDAAGAALPGASVRLLAGDRDAGTATSDVHGGYAIGGVVPGRYRLTVGLTGFKTATIAEVVVVAGRLTSVDIQLEVGALAETVTVMAESLPAYSAAATASAVVEQAGRGTRPLTTPRLREYFPESLLWHPEIAVDEQGEARVRFTLPDSLTTWRLTALASTDDGRVAPARAEVVAYQPFFVQLDPPAHLTVGDRVELPLPVRNHTEADQHVTVVVSRDPALGGGESESKRVRVRRADVAQPTFELRAVEPARQAALTADARSATDGDRVRRRVEVGPYGEEQVELAAELVRGSARLEVDLPADALPGSGWGELRVLPSLRAHLLAAVEGLVQRPWGCAEQTISAAFPSLLLLELERPDDAKTTEVAHARRFLDAAVERLAVYEATGGGFAYWAGNAADPAVTAHGLRLLARARRAGASVSDRLIARARDALLRLQAEDGRWGGAAGERRSALLTAQVAGALAEAFDPPREERLEASLERAHAALGPSIARWDEPYLIAAYALFAERLGKIEEARGALVRLRALERRERAAGYWDLQTNTPFYGWGTAGRLETTGLVLQALERLGDGGEDQRRSDRALLFLLRRQDRYGVWWSTQATVNVLEGLMARLRSAPTPPAGPATAEVWLDGRPLRTLSWPSGDEVLPPILVDLGTLSPGRHVVELRGEMRGSTSVHLVAGYARRWPSAPPDQSGGLRFAVNHDHLAVRRGDAVTVTASVERVGFRGYGMMIAEIGLPPGADVDRVSLGDAQAATPGLGRYELRPDRVVLYLWPQAGGVTVRFRFRPRFAMEARSAPSRLWDYYNPEEAVSLPPAPFVVR